MHFRYLSFLTAAGLTVILSLIALLGFFEPLDNRIYDLVLWTRPAREVAGDILFLDIDDQAIAETGVFPWPRSVMAEGLLRLKEFGAADAILDIEYIDKSPTQINEEYLREGLRADFQQRFAEIRRNLFDLASALSAGHVDRDEAVQFTRELNSFIADEEENLYSDTLRIVQDNDEFLARAASSFGRTWATVNIWDSPLEGEQAERRPQAEELFSYPLQVAPDAYREAGVDLLPPIPVFMESIRGAGFTNTVIDSDGIRRRVGLVREVNGYWYLQLAMPALLEKLGSPRIELKKGALVLHGAGVPGSNDVKNIIIPLDKQNNMLLDWPKTSYEDSWSHFSFSNFSSLSRFERDIINYLEALVELDATIFPETSSTARRALAVYTMEMRVTAPVLNAAQEIGDAAAAVDLENVEILLQDNPQYTEYITEEKEYAEQITGYLDQVINTYKNGLEVIERTVKGKTCIIGRVDTGSTDIGANPFFSEYYNPGAHAAVWETVLRGASGSVPFIRILGPLWSVLLCVLLVPAFSFGISYTDLGWRMLWSVLAFVFSGAFCVILFMTTGLFLSPLITFIAFFVSFLVREISAFLSTDNEKRFIRKAFSTYLSEEVVAELVAHPEKLKLGGETRRITALFTDVRGFTSISEKLSAENLVFLLNDYLSALSDRVLENSGIIDKYEGDAMIAFFGAPIDLADHAIRACTAAVTIKELERELNARYHERGMSPQPLWTRIGINTGDAVVGNMGTQRRMDYTMMGHTVNLASRLEGVNKLYGTGIIASENTIAETGDRFLTRKLDRIRVVGIEEPVRIYELIGFADRANNEQRAKSGLFEAALLFYENRDWGKAAELFREVLRIIPDDTPASIFLNRSEVYRETPPPPEWDAVVNLTEK
ncbi:MAG: CHASE2 domain-containing protein [Treponema sp.]|jgi:adenylate cyclase|nr:CHASE2 domain-containing protein [Treponema sp.]